MAVINDLNNNIVAGENDKFDDYFNGGIGELIESAQLIETILTGEIGELIKGSDIYDDLFTIKPFKKPSEIAGNAYRSLQGYTQMLNYRWTNASETILYRATIEENKAQKLCGNVIGIVLNKLLSGVLSEETSNGSIFDQIGGMFAPDVMKIEEGVELLGVGSIESLGQGLVSLSSGVAGLASYIPGLGIVGEALGVSEQVGTLITQGKETQEKLEGVVNGVDINNLDADTLNNLSIEGTALANLAVSIGSLFGVGLGLNVVTRVSERVFKAADRYTEFMKKSGEHLALVTSTLTADYAQGNALITDHGVRQFNSHQFRVLTSTAAVIDSPMINFTSQQNLVTSRFNHLVSDIHQGEHFHFRVRAEDSLSLYSNHTKRVNVVGLQEASAEAEYIAGKMIIYGDVLWQQAGQPSRTALASGINKAQTLTYDAVDISAISSYGCIMNYASNHFAVVAKDGANVQQAGLFTAFDSPMIFLNCGIASNFAGLAPKSFSEIEALPELAKTDEEQPSGPTQVDNKTPEPNRYPSSLMTDESFKNYGKSGAGARFTNAPDFLNA